MNFDQACGIYAEKNKKCFDDASETIVKHVVAVGGSLSDDEITVLAQALADSGDKLQMPPEFRLLADAPSTGGPASLSTLLCPLLIASAGVKVPKLSATGSIAGAIDSMALIPGYKYDLAGKDFIQALRLAGIAHAEQSESFCPADESLIRCRRKIKKNDMMANASLAAASLLAKKVAIPDTIAAFDFRVGSTGNIGDQVGAAREAAALFFRVAKRLRITICITLTDNSTFPCSAVGRLESMELLWQVLTGTETVLELDRIHTGTCIQIAARACLLCKIFSSAEEGEQFLYGRLRSGRILELFGNHLKAQGTNLNAFRDVVHARDAQDVSHAVSPSRGFWVPPTLKDVKKVAKEAQANIGGIRKKCVDMRLDKQFGLRLLVDPGTMVKKSQPVAEIRYPRGVQLRLDWNALAGSTVDEPLAAPQYVIEHLFNTPS